MLSIDEIIDIFEDAFDVQDDSDKIKNIPFKVSELKDITLFLHHIRIKGYYEDYMSHKQNLRSPHMKAAGR